MTPPERPVPLLHEGVRPAVVGQVRVGHVVLARLLVRAEESDVDRLEDVLHAERGPLEERLLVHLAVVAGPAPGAGQLVAVVIVRVRKTMLLW